MSGQSHLDNQIISRNPGTTRYRVARLITNVLSPPFVAIPAFITAGLQDANRGNSSFNAGFGIVLAITFGFTIPVIFVLVLRSLNKVTDVHIPVRQQRTLPFLVTLLSYALGTALLWGMMGPGFLTAILFCYTVNGLVVLFINFWWKISVHMGGIGAAVAFFFALAGWVAVPLFLLFPVVGWSRVYLKAHTPGQVVAGSLLGFFLTYFQLVVIFHNLPWFPLF